MTNFAFWQNKANQQGLVMCVLCFESKNVELMFKDSAGRVWDTCLDCDEHEKEVLAAREKPEWQTFEGPYGAGGTPYE